MTACSKCGQPIQFEKRQGKWFPTNPDGSDHWDGCKTVQRRRSGMIKVDGSLDWKLVEKTHPTITTHPRKPYSHHWISHEPPWDESLGAFRDFTALEKAQSVVCAAFAGR